MANSYFRFKQFTIHQDHSAMKVTTDGCLFGAWVAEEIKKQHLSVNTVLDIGAGTGLLSLMLAQKTNAVIDAVEIEEAAARQAMANAGESPWKERIKVIHEDIMKTGAAGKDYDVIISNPPFYEKELRSADDRKNIAHHGGGLLLEPLLQVIKGRLSPSGVFFLLLPFKRKKEMEWLFKSNNLFFQQRVSVRQTTGHDYFRLMIAGSLRDRNKTEESEIAIRDEEDQYTPEFTALLKDYYLYL